MEVDILIAKQEILETQLKIIDLNLKKRSFVRNQEYETAVLVQKQIHETQAKFENLVTKWTVFLDSQWDVEYTELLFLLAPFDNRYKSLISEEYFQKKSIHLKDQSQIRSLRKGKINTDIELIRQKNQLLQIFITFELLIKQWTEYHHFQKESLPASTYLDLIKYKDLALSIFPEMQSVYCFYGDSHALISQVKNKFSSRSNIFDPFLQVLIQYGSRNGTTFSYHHEQEINRVIKETFVDVPIFFDEKYRKMNNEMDYFLFITIKPDFSALNVADFF